MEVVCLISETKLIYINDYSFASLRLAVSKPVDNLMAHAWTATSESGTRPTILSAGRVDKMIVPFWACQRGQMTSSLRPFGVVIRP